MPAINCTLLCHQETVSCRMLFFWFHQGKQLQKRHFGSPARKAAMEICLLNAVLSSTLTPTFSTEPVTTEWSPHEPRGFCSLSLHHASSCSISRLGVSHPSPLRHCRLQILEKTGNPASSVCLRCPAACARSCSPHHWNGGASPNS